MTVVIIDASTLTAFLLEEEGDQEKKVRDLLIQGVSATELVITESCNAILTALRRRRINEEQAEKAFEVLLSFIDTNIQIFRQSESLLHQAFQNARENGLAIYDSIYIVLAQQLNGSLSSRDPKQIEIARKLGVKVIV